MKVYKYGNYQEYVDAQVKANVKKINKVWVREETIRNICKICPDANAILCHGTRNAEEQKLFRKFNPDAEIIGTEISHTATDFPMTVQHDFHETRNDWIGKFDIVYSNAFDHSYDPDKSLDAWKKQLADKGNLFIEHSFEKEHNKSRASDPLELSIKELLGLFENHNLLVVAKLDTTRENTFLFQLRLH